MRRNEELLVDLLHYARLAVGRAPSVEARMNCSLHPLLVISEAAKKLSPEFRRGAPEIPWDKIAGMRDGLIHAYDRVDWRIVWETVTLQVPTLISFLEHRGVADQPPR
jgi:uncharacterized protein with HEPN domain